MGEWAQHGREGSSSEEGDAPSAAKVRLAVPLATASRTSGGRQRSKSGFSAGHRIPGAAPGAALKRELQLGGGTFCLGGGGGGDGTSERPRSLGRPRMQGRNPPRAWGPDLRCLASHNMYNWAQNHERQLGVVFLQELGLCAQLLPQPLSTRKSLPG